MYEINLLNIASIFNITYFNMSSKNRVTLATYLKQGKDKVLGKKIIEEDGAKFVVKIGVKYVPNTNQKYSGN